MILKLTRLSSSLLLLLILMGTQASGQENDTRHGPSAAPFGGGGVIAFASQRQGNWDLYTLDVVTGRLRRVTMHPAPDRSPAWSPDGTRLAFQSRRDGNWEVYLLHLTTGELERLTKDPAYDGAPSWSPDGQKIAFESYRAGDLDIFVMEADGTRPVNLTPNEPAGDYGPAWSPDGTRIAFTSWRDGNKEVYLMAPDGTGLRNLTGHEADDEDPAWSPDGQQLAFVSQRDGVRRVHVMAVDGEPVPGRTLPYLGSDASPAWSPDGRQIIFASRQSTDDQALFAYDLVRGTMARLTYGPWVDARPAWNGQAADPYRFSIFDFRFSIPSSAVLELQSAIGNPKSATLEDPGHPLEFKNLPNTTTTIARLSDGVDDSFNALREQVKVQSGYDFLSELSEALRPLDFHSEASQYMSWHKAGRAIDLLWELRDGTRSVLEVAREDVGGETFWRLYLRCARQDGSQGEPLTVNLWDLSYKARVVDAPGRGGQPKGISYGYYLDFTDLARAYGWERISSHDSEDFNWRSNFLALEYWHYQKRDSLLWYDAVREVYSEEELQGLFNWQTGLDLGEDRYLMVVKGLPIPADAQTWVAFLPR